MEKLFNPKTVAVIGASRHKEKLGYQILQNLLKCGFKGKIFPVNPEAKEILALPAFKSVKDIQEDIDLAVIVVPAKIVPEVLQSCVEKEVAFAVVISSGFSEIGEKGKILQDEIKDVIIKTSTMRVLGPNCLGIINTQNNLNASFAAPALSKGHVAAIFQSGALGSALLDWAHSYEFGFSKFISLGNKVDLDETEIIEFLENDRDTKIIALYLEDISNLKKFLDATKKTAAKKPIVILKGGTTRSGATAAFSHTAALITPYFINKAIFAQANLIVAKTIEEMLCMVELLSCEPPVTEKKLGIITNAGGPAIITTDEAIRAGLTIAKLSPKTTSQLKKKLPAISAIANPVDLTGEAPAKSYELALESLIDDPSIASIIVLLTPQTMTEIEGTAQILAKYGQSKKPIVASFLGDKLVAAAVEILRAAKVPHYSEPEEAVKALNRVTSFWQKFYAAKDEIEITQGEPEIKSAGDTLELLERYNIPIPPSGIATNMDVAMKIVGRIGFPVALKNISKKYVHKFKAGKVVLNVQNEAFLKHTILRLGYPVLIQRMVDSPFEIIIGAKRDKNLGILITFGWGGVFTEDINDIATRILPLTEIDLDEMIKETKIGRILIRENVDLSVLKNILIDTAQIMTDFNAITELDLNPVKVVRDGAYCVDARYK